MGKKIRARSLVIGVLFTLFFMGLAAKLYVVQVVEGAELRGKAERVWKTQSVLQPTRGTITDRLGNFLALDGEAYTVAVNPRLIHKYNQAAEVVETLAPLLGITSPEGISKLYGKVTAKREDGTLLAQVEIRNEGWKIDKELADRLAEEIEKRQLAGVYLIPEKKRYYPMNRLASHVLGYVDKDNVARSGIELFYDEVLKGEPGVIQYEKDALGYELPNGKASVIPPKNGKNIKLTIDANIQHYIEDALAKMVAEYHPQGAMMIAADPHTMEILGMASLPNFNPNAYWQFESELDFANRNIGALYEPGSTFKIVTLAGAVAEGLFDPDEKFASGMIRIAGTPMGDHNNRQGWGEITYLEGLKRSSNVAFIKLGYEKLGEEKFREYIRKFGFGQLTGIDLPGEAAGRIDFRYPTEIAAATFGQGKVLATALQQVAAVAAIANGGKLMKPHLLKEIVDPLTGKTLEKYEPVEVGRVLSESAARQVSEYLEQVVSDQQIGTGRRVYIEGYRIAGKTGTAQKVVDGKYSDRDYVVSFIGYAPADDPKIVLSIIVDSPDIGGDYRRGSEVSAPVFKEVMGKVLRYLDVPKENTTVGVTERKTAQSIVAPDLKGKRVEEAAALLARNRLSYDRLGAGGTVIGQYPHAGTSIGQEQRVYLLTQEPEGIAMPDMRGRSLRDVIEVCSLLERECVYHGSGYVSSQQSGNSSQTDHVFYFEPLGVKPGNEESQQETDIAAEGGSASAADGEAESREPEEAAGS